jgi:glycerol-3-phosphate acyltransferase PlsY
MTPLVFAIAAILSYLLGSIPTGYLMAKAKGVDIRSVGSGNIGATNVFRALGKPAGIITLLVDCAKGFVAVAVVPKLFAVEHRQLLELACALAVIFGHNYTCWLQFKGGKGIATSAGVLLALVPWALITILTIWIVVFAATRYVSLASLAASASLPFASWATHESVTKVIVTGAMGALAIYKHKANIQRLLKGTEPRFGRKTEEAGK